MCGNLFSSLESSTTFDERFKVTSVPFFTADLKLLSCELEILHLMFYIESFYIKTKTAPCEKLKSVF